MTHAAECQAGTRFAFGENWQSFLTVLTAQQIEDAVVDLGAMLGVETLAGKTFLDIGSGSGLSSLAAMRLGATVHSFDFDPASVACTRELKRRYYTNHTRWVIQEGSALDPHYLESLGQFDVVYSWGVLHHTGAMWTALDNVVPLVKPNGLLFLALYNDQGVRSRFWWWVKRCYCSGSLGRNLMAAWYYPYAFLHACAVVMLKPQTTRARGMSVIHDWRDWLGGFPFDVASVEAVSAFYARYGFTLANLKATTRLGNNQFVFQRQEQP